MFLLICLLIKHTLFRCVSNTGQTSERDTFKDAVRRKHLVSKQDCYNKRNKLGCNAVHHAEVARSVDLFVKKLPKA